MQHHIQLVVEYFLSHLVVVAEYLPLLFLKFFRVLYPSLLAPF
jgi:hypothetical protein